ncbi:MAG TPA: saccharopine dehydrogenase C-terminal domain-containing protein [Opitutus sp.]|nr:saccharopine dehydrogenase C-terminal domain-containing protein [Opitutus sp.]
MEFKNRILMIGHGIVAQALLPMLVRHLHLSCSQIVIIDFADREPVLEPWIARGVTFLQERVTPLSLTRLLSAHARGGDLIIDLAWSVDFFDIIRWAHDHEVLYVNASLESWDPSAEMGRKPTLEKSLYNRYARLLPLIAQWRDGATAVVDHGSNPGLVSHFVKHGLLDIGAALLREKRLPAVRKRRLELLLQEQLFPELAQELGVRVIHCSEWDTQRADKAKSPDEFVSTWSPEGMWEESISPCEIGWGTHEKWIPPLASLPEHGPRNQIVLPQMGLNTWIRSWVPHHEIVGMVVTHGESFGLSHALTVRENDRPVYRPTVHYAYTPCNDSLVSLHELRARNYELHPKRRILANEIVSGSDLVGALIMGHGFRSWWTGSILSIEEARERVPGVNATAVQVAAGVLAAVVWAVRHPRAGICLPEDLPHEAILETARPYLGTIVSMRSDWSPLGRERVYFEEKAEPQVDRSDPWQFRNFLFRP